MAEYQMDRIIQGIPITTGEAVTRPAEGELAQLLGNLRIDIVRRFAEKEDLQSLQWGIHQWTSQAKRLDDQFGEGGVLAGICWRIAEIYAEGADRRFGTTLLESTNNHATLDVLIR